MAKKYNGGWGIRVRKNVKTCNKLVWLDENNKLSSIEQAKKYASREDAYFTLNSDLYDMEFNISGKVIDCNDFAVEKLPIAAKAKQNINPNPNRPWDVIFDSAKIPSPIELGFACKQIDLKSKDGKKLLDLICRLFGI